MHNYSIEDTKIEGLRLITPFYSEDERGYFLKDFEKTVYQCLGIDDVAIAECFETGSNKNIIRGMHFQTCNPQAKIVRIITGRIFDVVVDLRKGSQTFGKWQGFEFSTENRKVLYIPKGCAHGFMSFCDNSLVSYKCIGKYDRETDTGILWNDPDIGIEWPLAGEAVISKRDKTLMSFNMFIEKYGGL
jgi:dTDP-4-dehydrorhamnose 3,5-epimerase